MKHVDAEEYRAQAKHCRELAMSTVHAGIEQALIRSATDLEGEASRLERSSPPALPPVN